MRTWPALEIQQADDDELIQAFLIDFNLAAIEGFRFFFHTTDDRDRAAAALRAEFRGIDAQSIDVPDEDWAARSQAALRAITVGVLTVAPPWDLEGRLKPAPTAYVGAGFSQPSTTRFSQPSTIVIQPSMGFGTGHHATTRLCLAALQEIDVRGRSMIDVGTGSGVLAIAARKLGASGVLALDDDPDAIAAAEANVALNHESRIALEIGDFRSAKIGQFDLVTANLTSALLIACAERLESLTIPGGHLILSGFMDDEEREVLRAFEGSTVEWRAQEDEWVCFRLTT
jgi:ribosomal protein L11 methyltransferase